MTPQEIQERNKQIALMLGYENMSPDKLLLFHSDWSWLMDAVEFIEKVYMGYAYFVRIEGNKCQISVNTQFNLATDKFVNIYHRCSNKQESVFMSVSDFAKIYNNHNHATH